MLGWATSRRLSALMGGKRLASRERLVIDRPKDLEAQRIAGWTERLCGRPSCCRDAPESTPLSIPVHDWL